MKLSLAITTPDVKTPIGVALLSGSFEEKLEKAARLGFDGVELMVVQPQALNGKELRQAAQERGLAVAAIASGAIYAAEGLSLLTQEPSARARARQKLADLIHLAAETGAGVVTLGSFRGRTAWVEGLDAVEELAQGLHTAAGQAEEAGVRLALEPLNRYETDFIHTAAQALEFARRVAVPSLGVLLDTFHMNIEEAAPLASVEQILASGRLYHVHVADSNRKPPGQGHVDFSALVDALRAGGYAGYLSAELFPFPDPDLAAQATAAVMRPLLV
jgi:5-keto-L-gluconate epimerase